METTRWSRLAALYAGTVFVSAFLLFQVQPLISRFILPWFGGGPAIWNVCLVFFQMMLFAGYAYAHLSEHYFRPRVRTVVHLILIGAALLTLPIAPSDWWKPADSAYPTGRILALLAVCVGLPYFVLSSTGPLVQAWFSQTLPGKSPYRLYSLSNLGSLLALLSYPFVVEPLLDGHAQSWSWSAGFVLFAALSATACWQTARLRLAGNAMTDSATFPSAGADPPGNDRPAPSWLHRLLWLLLPAFASVLLLATTNHICLDVPSVPFLWIAPLSLYLLSFIIAFDHERWYRRLPYALVALVTIYMTAGMYNTLWWGEGWLGYVHNWLWGPSSVPWQPKPSYSVDLFCQLAGLLALCMLCHGELVRLRPPPRYLTSFYLMISAGGALGGLSVSLVAPQIFKSYSEWPIGLALGFVLAAVTAFVLTGWRRPRFSLRNVLRVGGILISLLALVEIVHQLWGFEFSGLTILERSRNFYGVLTVVEPAVDNPLAAQRVLFNGSTRHGMQFLAPAARQVATTYYSDGSAIGQTLEFYQLASARKGEPLRIGAVGLGVGTLAAYVYQPWHTIRFYEIDPDDRRLAEKYFTYLADARERSATVEIVLGDARLSLEREEPQGFNVLILDAFSSDSIPIHLLTKEAFDVYLKHLAPGGAIAVHISNRNINLAPVVYGLSEVIKLDLVRIFTNDIKRSGWAAEWIILSQNQELLESLRAFKDNYQPGAPPGPLPLWTDQRHNLLGVLRWSNRSPFQRRPQDPPPEQTSEGTPQNDEPAEENPVDVPIHKSPAENP